MSATSTARRRISETMSMEEGLRKRQSHQAESSTCRQKRWIDDWDPDLPYGGRIFLARQKNPDSWVVFFLQVLAVLFAFGLSFYAYFYFDRFHYHVTRGYANIGYPEAQHVLGDKLFHGHGVEPDKHQAMEWYKLAADQGHPEASYNLAVGHLKGIRKDLLQKGEPHSLIRKAASSGVKEALEVLNNLCLDGQCEE